VHHVEAVCGRERSGFAAEIPSGFSEGSMKKHRLWLALAAFAMLGLLTWKTITDEKLRLATFLVLALFAVKTFLRRKDVMQGNGDDSI
jgi:hypothetical protein